MNGASPATIALGFKLTTLLKFNDTKSMDNKSSLLHYLIKLLNDKYDAEEIGMLPLLDVTIIYFILFFIYYFLLIFFIMLLYKRP